MGAVASSFAFVRTLAGAVAAHPVLEAAFRIEDVRHVPALPHELVGDVLAVAAEVERLAAEDDRAPLARELHELVHPLAEHLGLGVRAVALGAGAAELLAQRHERDPEVEAELLHRLAAVARALL